MNKVLVQIYIPTLSEEYDLFLPINKKIVNIIYLIQKALIDINPDYKIDNNIGLYDRITGNKIDVDIKIKDSNIRNGSKLMLV